MATKLKKVINPLETSEELVGAEFTNQLVDLLHGVSLDVDENDLAVNTIIRFWKNKLALFDINQTHLFLFSTEEISDEVNKTILWRDITEGNIDSPVYEVEPQILLNKTLGVDGIGGTNLGEDLDALGFTVNNLGKLMMHDMGDRNINVLYANGTNPNTVWDFIKGYNTETYAALNSATDIKVRFGWQSEIDVYEWWSETTGSNIKLLSLAPTLAEFNVTAIDFKDATINNFQQKQIEFLDVTSEPVGTSTVDFFYREDIDANNHRGYISKFENGVPVRIRVY